MESRARVALAYVVLQTTAWAVRPTGRGEESLSQQTVVLVEFLPSPATHASDAESECDDPTGAD